MGDRLPTKREARVLDAMGSWVYEKPSGFSASEWVALEEQGWIEPQADLPDDHYYYARRTLEGRAALANYRKAQVDIADDVTRYDADLARLVAAAQPFREWAEMIEGDGKTVLVDKTVWMPTDTQTVKITVQDLHMLMATIDDVLSKGELK